MLQDSCLTAETKDLSSGSLVYDLSELLTVGSGKLKYYGIAHTPTLAIEKLSEILHDDKLVNGIINKKLEGYVLTERHTEVQGLIIQAMKLLGDV